MTSGLEERMAFHSGTHHFGELENSMATQMCDANLEASHPFALSTAQIDEYHQHVADTIDAAVLETPQDASACTFGSKTFELMKFVKHNPPDVSDLIAIFAGNTRLTLAAAAEAVRTVLDESGTCLDSASGVADAEASARIKSKLKATGLPQSVFATNSSTRVSAKSVYLAIPTVYHKLAAMCYPRNTTMLPLSGEPMEVSDVCVDTKGDISQGCMVMAASTDQNPIFDLVTSTSLASCSGDACKAAARAVLSYQQLLSAITPMRLDTVQVAQGSAPGRSRMMEQSTWVFQRNCAALEKIVDRAQHIQVMLPAVLSTLRAAAPQLEVACVAPAGVRGDIGPAYLVTNHTTAHVTRNGEVITPSTGGHHHQAVDPGPS